MGKIVGILSLKGGVGKTSSVLNLGSCFSKMGKKTLLVDCNYSAPNLGLHLNIINPEKTLHGVLNREIPMEEAVHELDSFHIVPCRMFKEPKTNPLKLKDHVKFLKKKYDVIILDSSPSLNDETLSVMLASDELVFVTTPDNATLGTTLKAIREALSRGFRVSGIILNKVYGKDFEVSVDEIERTLDIPVLAVVPHNLEMVKSISESRPWCERKPNSRGVLEYKKLAHALMGEKYKENKLKNIWKKLTPSRQEINREIYYQSVFE